MAQLLLLDVSTEFRQTTSLLWAIMLPGKGKGRPGGSFRSQGPDSDFRPPHTSERPDSLWDLPLPTNSDSSAKQSAT